MVQCPTIKTDRRCRISWTLALTRYINSIEIPKWSSIKINFFYASSFNVKIRSNGTTAINIFFIIFIIKGVLKLFGIYQDYSGQGQKTGVLRNASVCYNDVKANKQSENL